MVSVSLNATKKRIKEILKRSVKSKLICYNTRLFFLFFLYDISVFLLIVRR